MKKYSIKNQVLRSLKNRKNILLLEKAYDALVPQFIKDSRVFNTFLYKKLIGPWFDVDFKQKYSLYSNKDWVRLYDSLYKNRIREEDVTQNQKTHIINNIFGNNVVDVGCGSGFFCKEIVKMRKISNVVGCDLSPVAIADNNKRFKKYPNLKFKVENIASLRFRDKSFDTVVCSHVIEHIVDYKKAIKELIRISTKRIIIVVPEEKFKKYSPDYHVNYFNRENMIESHVPNKVNLVDSRLVDGDRCIILDR